MKEFYNRYRGFNENGEVSVKIPFIPIRKSESDIILNYEYTLQVNQMTNDKFNGTFQKTYTTEMTVVRVKVLDNGKVSTMLENKAHCIGKKYDKNEIIEIK